MKRDGLMLATMPSMGSDWVAECICKANPELRYAREFFNPTCNWRLAERLERDLGDITYSAVPQLCEPASQQAIDELIAETWRRDGRYTFTKECYLAFQLERFAPTFSIVVLLRSFRETFPPNRQRVMRWYENFHGALKVAGQLDRFCWLNSTTPMNRAAIGYYFFASRLLGTASFIGAPVLSFDELSLNSEVAIANRFTELRFAGLPINGPAFAATVVETRKIAARPSEHEEQWRAATELYGELELRYGQL